MGVCPLQHLVYVVRDTGAREVLPPSSLPTRPLNPQDRQVTKPKMANKFVSFGPSICRGIRHFRGLKVPKWDALSRYTAFRYMSSIVDRKFSSPFHKSEQIDQSVTPFHTQSYIVIYYCVLKWTQVYS